MAQNGVLTQPLIFIQRHLISDINFLSKIFLTLFFVLCVGMLMVPSQGFAQGQPTDVEVETVQQLLIQLKSSDKHQASAAAWPLPLR